MRRAVYPVFCALLLSACNGGEPLGNEPPQPAVPSITGSRPDFSGVWVLQATNDWGIAGLPSGPEFFNIGASLPGGTLPYQPWAAAYVEETRSNMRAVDPLTHCHAIGPIRAHAITFYREIVHLPNKIVFLNEYNTSYRQVFTDGRALPDNPVPSLNGYSTGSWDGDELVVETTGFRDRAIWLDNNGSPLTDAARITERFRRPSVDRLEIDVTVDDPKAYTVPWTVTLKQNLARDTELLDAICDEEELVDLLDDSYR
jgi:hypothetical protein